MNLISFDPVEVAAIVSLLTVAVQLVKSGFERLEEWESAPEFVRSIASWWAHSKGPVVISVLIPLLGVVLPDIIADGKLTFAELKIILDALGVSFMSNLVYLISRRKKFFKGATE